tara:strand:- start:1175 stop:1429 length:255 start_codon:yes stop_codon:yes gene_type:complete
MLYSTCPTCGFLLADKEVDFEEGLTKINELYEKKIKESNIKDTKLIIDKEQKDQVYKLINKLGINRYCCRMRLITYVNQAELII